MELDRSALESIVAQVVENLQKGGAPAAAAPKAEAPKANAPAPAASKPASKVTNDLKTGDGVFASIEEAIAAAKAAFAEYSKLGLSDRKVIVDALRKAALDSAHEMADLAWRESAMGRYEDKVLKNQMAAQGSPGVESLKPYETFVGDLGTHMVYNGPWGVIGAITPVTNPTSTIINNAIIMLAAGNTVVFGPHPQAMVCSIKQLQILSRAVREAGGPDNLMTCVIEPTIRTASEIFKSDDIAMICATGGPGVVRAAMENGKRVVGAGAGNPPVIVDDTADIKRAAWSIVEGAKFDNDLPCVGEKEIFVVDSVADALIRELKNQGALYVPESKVDALTSICIKDGKANRTMVGQNAELILKAAGVDVSGDPPIGIFETDFENEVVQEEQLMPIVPIVRCRSFEQALEYARLAEHGYTHTALMHSTNIARITEFTRVMQCTITIINGPSYAYTGTEGEGYVTLTVGTKTGDGVSNPLTFTRRRHTSFSRTLNLI